MPTLRTLSPSEWSALRAAVPEAVPMPARLVRRVIRRTHGLEVQGLEAPHDQLVWTDRAMVLSCVDRSELPMDGSLPEQVLLLPTEDSFEPARIGSTLELGRLLFHALADRATADPATDPARIAWYESLPELEREEIEAVLVDENRLVSGTIAEKARETLALFAELEYGTTYRTDLFPGVSESRLRAGIRTLLPIDAIRAVAEQFLPRPIAAEPSPPPVIPSPTADPTGNDVRAAMLAVRAGNVGQARRSLENLRQRVAAALNLTGTEPDAWAELFAAIDLTPLTQSWPYEARFLWRVQLICLEVERRTFAIEPMEWLLSFGKRAVKRPLDLPRDCNLLKRVRQLARMAEKLKIPTDVHQHFAHALHGPMARLEASIRERFGPILRETLDRVDLKPTNIAERISREQVVAELLDGICERGFCRMSDLRDALARNRLKLPDVRTIGQFIHGDALLRMNRVLPDQLDGVYQRGEIYLRMLQRFSSLFFGTWLGRLFVLWLVLPFGGAFVLLEGVSHFIHAIGGLIHAIVGGESGHHGSMVSEASVIGVGFFLMLMIHAPRLRAHVGRAFKIVLYEIPQTVWNSPPMQFIFDNQCTRLFRRYILVPLLTGILASVLAGSLGMSTENTVFLGIGVGIVAAVLFRTAFGRTLEDTVQESLARVWNLVSVRFLLNALEFVVWLSKIVLEGIERGIYAVDEWLRFREGDNRLGTVFKMAFGVFWFFFTYLFRFAWNLLIEPQINPIKHFPVVTVSHKLCLPLIPSIASATGLSLPTTTTIVSGIPGIFGFLVWEFKENWKLFRANGSRTLRPALIGGHGEKMRGLLAPGFHSGAIPKLFSKLRRAHRTNNDRRVARLRHQEEHLREAIARFIEREGLAYLHVSNRWNGRPIHLGGVALATRRVRMTLISDVGPITLAIEYQGGYLLGCVSDVESYRQWSGAQQAAFRDMLAGLYARCGLNATREQLAGRAHAFPEAFPAFDAEPIAWSAWVEQWEEDIQRRGPATTLLTGEQYRLVPSRKG